MENESMFSAERLVEFGLGMAMARQMVEMFNQTMTPMNTTIPTPGLSPAFQRQPISTPSIYVGIDGKPMGPLSEYEFLELYRNKRITKDSLVWISGMANWQRIEETPNILRIIAMVNS